MPAVKNSKKNEEGKKMKGDADSSEEDGADEDEEKDVKVVMAERKAAEAKLKKDLAQEGKEMAKTLMTKRQR